MTNREGQLEPRVRRQSSSAEGGMRSKVGIWIDHKTAFIVSASSTGVSTKTLESGAGPHSPYAARASYPTSDGSKRRRGEKKYEGRYGEHLDQYYDQVIDQIRSAGEVLIFGPGEAKLQLKERIGRLKMMTDRIVGVEPADQLTRPQIVAKVKEHFKLGRQAGNATRAFVGSHAGSARRQ